jgi:hypothetical protein
MLFSALFTSQNIGGVYSGEVATSKRQLTLLTSSIQTVLVVV